VKFSVCRPSIVNALHYNLLLQPDRTTLGMGHRLGRSDSYLHKWRYA